MGSRGWGARFLLLRGGTLFVRLSDRRGRGYGAGFMGEGWGNGTIGGAEER